MKHTEGKLKIYKHKTLSLKDWYELQSEKVTRDQLPLSICVISDGHEQPAQANAQRMVDCWNGCKGIENPLAVGELLEACKLALANLGAIHNSKVTDFIFNKLKQAIKKVEKEV